MAKVFIFPLISPEEYPLFRQDFASAFPATQIEWAKLSDAELAMANAEGKTVIEKPVRYDEFARYCLANRLQHTPKALHDFAKNSKILRDV